MSRFILLPVVVVFCFIQNSSGQNLPAIQTDRPDQTECPFIVPAKHLQVETGVLIEQTDDQTKSYEIPSILYKYGVNDRFELRLITEFASIKSDITKISGLNPVTVGFKANLSQEKGLMPITSFIGHLTIPRLAGENLKATYYAPAFRFTMQNTISQVFTLSYNLGAEWDGETPEPSFIYTLSLGISLSEKIGSYVEVFGFAPQRLKAYHHFDCGFSYLLKQNISLDISGGCRLTKNTSKYYAALGFSFRLKD